MQNRAIESRFPTPTEYMRDMQSVAKLRFAFFKHITNCSNSSTKIKCTPPNTPNPYDPQYEKRREDKFKVPDQLELNAIAQAKGLYNFTCKL